MKKIIAIIPILLFVPGIANAQEIGGYLCIAQQSTGFKFNETTNKWDTVNFNIDDSKYIIRKSRANDERIKPPEYLWSVTVLGNESPTMGCKRDFNESDFIACEGGGYLFKFSSATMRYLVSYWGGGYVQGNKLEFLGKEFNDTPFVEIGTCSKI